MNHFRLVLQDATHTQTIDNVSSFVGEDPSGSFGIQAQHTRFCTALIIGLARYRQADSNWIYLAMPGAILYFNNNQLTISSRRYLHDTDYNRISAALEQQLVREEADLRKAKDSLRQMEEAILTRMWELGRLGLSQP